MLYIRRLICRATYCQKQCTYWTTLCVMVHWVGQPDWRLHSAQAVVDTMDHVNIIGPWWTQCTLIKKSQKGSFKLPKNNDSRMRRGIVSLNLIFF